MINAVVLCNPKVVEPIEGKAVEDIAFAVNVSDAVVVIINGGVVLILDGKCGEIVELWRGCVGRQLCQEGGERRLGLGEEPLGRVRGEGRGERRQRPL